MLKCLNPCDGLEFMYQWALRNSHGPTETDIFRKLQHGGSMIDVLEDNNLLDRDMDGALLWRNVTMEHFYKDIQFQPLHRRDREGIIQCSVDEMHRLFTETFDFVSVPAGALQDFRQTHGEVHLVFYDSKGIMSLACLQSHMPSPSAVLMACAKMDHCEASLVAGHLHNGPSEVVQLVRSIRGGQNLLVQSVAGVLSVPSCDTSLAVINDEHQKAFADHCKKAT